MAVLERTGYGIQCDFPGCGLTTADIGDYSFWGDLGTAIDEWQDHDGVYTDDGRAFCGDHVVWGEDEDGDVERIPMEPTLANLILLANRRVLEKILRAEREALQRLDRRCREMSHRIDVRAAPYIQYVPF